MPADRDVDCCDFLHAHEDLVEAVRQRMPDEVILNLNVVFFPARSEDW